MLLSLQGSTCSPNTCLPHSYGRREPRSRSCERSAATPTRLPRLRLAMTPRTSLRGAKLRSNLGGDEILHGPCPEHYSILRSAQNDKKRRVQDLGSHAQNDRKQRARDDTRITSLAGFGHPLRKKRHINMELLNGLLASGVVLLVVGLVIMFAGLP